jgi:hypothetical protein
MANVFGWPEPVPGQQPYLVALDQLVTAIDGTVASWWAEVRSAATTTVVISKPPPLTDVSVPAHGSIVIVQSAGLVAPPEPVRLDLFAAYDLQIVGAGIEGPGRYDLRIWQGATLVASTGIEGPALHVQGREQFPFWQTLWLTLPPAVPLWASLNLFYEGDGLNNACYWPRSGPVHIMTMRPAPVGGW